MKELIMTDYNGEEINLTEEFNLSKNWDTITDGTMSDLEVVELYLEWQELTISELQELCENWWSSDGFNVDGLKMVDLEEKLIENFQEEIEIE